jgi:DhnA family fructose-bisphosphate aldolase class Ia
MRVHSAIHFGLLAAAALVAFTSAYSRAQTTENADAVRLADGTPVHLVLMDDLQGKRLQVKQTVHFKVREDLVVDSKLIVKTGAEAVGHIESISKNGLLGKSGRLVLQFDYVTTMSGARLPLRGGAGVSGGKGGALTWESALWYGPDASMPVGTVINAFVDHDQRVLAP